MPKVYSSASIEANPMLYIRPKLKYLKTKIFTFSSQAHSKLSFKISSQKEVTLSSGNICYKTKKRSFVQRKEKKKTKSC